MQSQVNVLTTGAVPGFPRHLQDLSHIQQLPFPHQPLHWAEDHVSWPHWPNFLPRVCLFFCFSRAGVANCSVSKVAIDCPKSYLITSWPTLHWWLQVPLGWLQGRNNVVGGDNIILRQIVRHCIWNRRQKDVLVFSFCLLFTVFCVHRSSCLVEQRLICFNIIIFYDTIIIVLCFDCCKVSLITVQIFVL